MGGKSWLQNGPAQPLPPRADAAYPVSTVVHALEEVNEVHRGRALEATFRKVHIANKLISPHHDKTTT